MTKNRKTSNGICSLCGEQFSKASIAKHLAKCNAQHELESKGKGRLREIIQLKIEDRYCPDYWLQVETASDSQFAAVDSFLRHTWLECCGHCSAFRLPQLKLAAATRGNKSLAVSMAAFEDFDDIMREEAALMRSKLGGRVKVGDKFDYEYDFGSTTALRLQVVGKRDGKLRPGGVRLLARNLPPDIRCVCGEPAINVCSQCSWELSGWLCKTCSKKHDCGDEMFLPVVNSPRVGVCAYCGPDQ